MYLVWTSLCLTAVREEFRWNPSPVKGSLWQVEHRPPFWQDLLLPFTLAHPAAVLPFRRTRLLAFSALIVGSLAPDLPYFLIFSEKVRIGHTVRGLFLLCLPVGLAVLWLWHAVVKRPMASLAPEFVRQRISTEELQFRFWPISRFVVIVVSLLLGSSLHIVWDGFTHENGYFVKHWASLTHLVMLWEGAAIVEGTAVRMQRCRRSDCRIDDDVVVVEKADRG